MLLCLAHSNLFSLLCLALSISEIIHMHGGQEEILKLLLAFYSEKGLSKSTL